MGVMLNTNTVSIDELRSNLAEIINRVTYANDQVVVKKHNRDVAMIISLDEYEKIMDPSKRLSKNQWRKHVKKLDNIRSKIPLSDPDELDRIIDEEVEAVRAEKRVKGE